MRFRLRLLKSLAVRCMNFFSTTWCIRGTASRSFGPSGPTWRIRPTSCAKMSKVGEVCHHVRSKNAGPFWVTIDLFFRNEELFRRYRDAPALGPKLFERLYGTDPDLVKRLPVENLRMVKISFP